MSVFNLENQNKSLDNKIVAGLEKLSQVFRILLWEEAKIHNLSPIQIQILIFRQCHSAEKSTVSYLAQEFNVTKPTISDAVKVLEQKKLLAKIIDIADARSYTIKLTAAGKKIASATENFTAPVSAIIKTINDAEKIVLWDNISTLIAQLNKSGIISIQRTCYCCKYYSVKDKKHFCNLLNQLLHTRDIRIDCPEFCLP